MDSNNKNRYKTARVQCIKCGLIMYIDRCIKRIGQGSYALNKNYLENEELKIHMEETKHTDMNVSIHNE